MIHGWIILDKPVVLGSTTAVSAVKRILRQAGEPKTKVGHGGTLDPLASGVLPIALGEATKLCGRMLDATKSYDFTIRFGEETDTLDAEGRVIATSHARVARFRACRLRHGKWDVGAGEREQFAGLADRRVAEIPAGIGRERNGHVWKSNSRELVAVAIDLRDQ